MLAWSVQSEGRGLPLRVSVNSQLTAGPVLINYKYFSLSRHTGNLGSDTRERARWGPLCLWPLLGE